MYEGTLYGHWEAIVTLQQMLVLCGSDGVIDMTPQAIAARTSIPLDIITKGIAVLSEPDPYTRTPGEDGKRIILIDAHRPWGWLIVNYVKYRDLKSRAEKMEADRVRMADKRKANKIKDVADSRGESQKVAGVAKVAHADADADADADTTTTTSSTNSAEPQAATAPPAIMIPLVDKSEHKIMNHEIAEWSAAFPAVDVLQELRNMRQWCIANPRKQKTKHGVLRFIVSWLTREQDKPHINGGHHAKPSKLQRAAEAIRRANPGRYSPATDVQNASAQPGLRTLSGGFTGSDSGDD